MEIEETIEIARSVEDVYAYLRDPAELPNWIGGIVDFELRPDGSFTHVISQAGRKMQVVGTLEGLPEQRGVIMRLVGDEGRLEARHHLTPLDTGTRLDHTSKAHLNNPLLRMLLSGMKEAARRRLRDDLQRLRERLEG
jgi:carbon monoxide dehydrogenase subunit G